MSDIFRVLRWFVGLLIIGVVGTYFLPRGSALRPSDGFVDRVVNQAVNTIKETVKKELDVDLNKSNSSPVPSGKDSKVVPLHSVLEH